MLTPRPRTRPATTLVRPVRVSSILIPDERIVYNERRHWAYLVKPFIESMTVVGAAVIAVNLLDGARLWEGFLALQLTVGAAIMVAFGQWKKWPVYASAAALILGLFDARLMALILVAAFVRFFYSFAMWAFYERLFITNRRLIFAQGFMDSEIAMMPLSRITDISYKRPVIADLLGYGQLRVETAGQDQALGFINFINEPDKFYRRLLARSAPAVTTEAEKKAQEEAKKATEEAEKAGGGPSPASTAQQPQAEPTAQQPRVDWPDSTGGGGQGSTGDPRGPFWTWPEGQPPPEGPNPI